ncbi:hypothetical protein [Amycolatopsis sp. GA6-003]|uniref:hypothetical protein n=1 Tax=Amycolatopsis sp. GA6-003 TaxID=2652444 RepID=UPI0039174812
MTTATDPAVPEEAIAIDGDGNVAVSGDVDGDILVNVEKQGDQFFGDVRGFRDIIIRDEIDPGYISWILERFAEPPEFGDIVEALREPAAVFVHGPAHSGRWTTGVCALARWRDTGDQTINVIDFDDGTQLQLRRVTQKARVLLDLTKAGSEVLERVKEQLQAFLGTITKAKARLVVLLPEVPPPGLRPLCQGRLISITEPALEDVLRAHLLKTDVPANDVVAEGSWSSALSSAHPEDVARMAGLIADEYKLANGVGPLGIIVGNAIRAYGNWSAELVATYDKVNDPEQRSLLLTVALLGGGTTETQYWAERKIRELADYPVSSGRLLEGRGFTGRLTELDGICFTDDRARFGRLNYDRSILQHVWRGYPELRSKLVDWVIALGFSQQIKVDGAAAQSMVDRFFDLCAGQNVVKFASQAAKRWAESGKATPAQLAVRLLTEGALDDRSAALVHRQLNTWARKPDLSNELVELVLAVCRSDFARRYTDKALTRLGNLADHQNREVSDEVVETVLTIVRDNDAFPQALAKIDEWLRGSKVRQRAVAVRILLTLMSADAGVVDVGELTRRDHHPALVRVWRALLSQDDLALMHHAITAWFDLATPPGWTDPLLDALVEAAGEETGGRIDRIGAVRRAADGWLGVSPRYWPGQDHTNPRFAVYQATADKMPPLLPIAQPSAETEGV